jgi:transposase-like protein
MVQKRRQFTAQFKFDTVMEVLRGEKSVVQSCRERDIREALYYKWRGAFFERAPSVFEDQRRGFSEPSSDRVAELERMVGQLAMENAILKKVSSRLDTARRKNGT